MTVYHSIWKVGKGKPMLTGDVVTRDNWFVQLSWLVLPTLCVKLALFSNPIIYFYKLIRLCQRKPDVRYVLMNISSTRNCEYESQKHSIAKIMRGTGRFGWC